MTCDDLTNDLLSDYADWQLAPQERNRITRHLETCEGCRVRRDDLEGMTGALRRAPEGPPTAIMRELDRAVLGMLTRGGASRPLLRRRLTRPLLGGIAAIVLVGLVAFLAGRRMGLPVSPVADRQAAAVTPKGDRPATLPEPAGTSPVPGPAPRSEPAQPPPARIAKGGSSAPAVPSLPKPGDLNGDGVVDIADARILQQMITRGLPLPAHADVNGDGVVDIADVREILRAVLASR
jgi:anti-sigma factor RsiW